jgi:hypothetical protein
MDAAQEITVKVKVELEGGVEDRIREIVREEIEKATAGETVEVSKRIANLLGIELTKVERSDPLPGSKTIKGVPVIAEYAVAHNKAQ